MLSRVGQPLSGLTSWPVAATYGCPRGEHHLVVFRRRLSPAFLEAFRTQPLDLRVSLRLPRILLLYRLPTEDSFEATPGSRGSGA